MILRIDTTPGLGDLDPNAILWPSRDELSDQTDLLRSRIAGLGRDYFNADSSSVSQTLLSAWDTFVSGVTSWDWSPRILSHVIDATWRDELLAYQQQFNDFLHQFQAAGVTTSTPAFTFTQAAPSTFDKLAAGAEHALDKATKPFFDTLSAIKTVAIVGGVAALGYIFYLTFETGRTARHIGAQVVRR